MVLIFHFFLGSSSAAGDWVNCGICGEWAHFGCDRRQGLGAFKVTFLLPIFYFDKFNVFKVANCIRFILMILYVVDCRTMQKQTAWSMFVHNAV